jgi:superoxide dismutase, Cu-Zn family
MTTRIMTLAVMGLMGTALFAANKPVMVMLKDSGGKDVGMAKLSDGPGGKGVKIALTLKDLPAGEHALHFHAVAKCEGPGFTTAGGHFNPDTHHHGINNAESPKPHAGDMANFTVGPKGTYKATVINTAVTLGDGPTSLFTAGGTALMIHAKADDLKSDPAGNAGDRLACGTITK